MINPKSKKDREIFLYLQANLSEKYQINYKYYYLSLERFNLKIDYIISLKSEFLEEKTRPISYYIQNAQNASMIKLVRIYDLLLSFTSVTVIWDEDDIKAKLKPLVTMLNSIVEPPKEDTFFSQSLRFLMFCDTNEEEEMDRYKLEVTSFNDALIELEDAHGIEDSEEVEEDDNLDEC